MITSASHLPVTETPRVAGPQSRASEDGNKNSPSTNTPPRYAAGFAERYTEGYTERYAERYTPRDVPNKDASKQSLLGEQPEVRGKLADDPLHSSNKTGAWSQESFAAGLAAYSTGQAEPVEQQPFHAAWIHALSQDDIGGVVSRMAKLIDCAQLPPGMRLNNKRLNPDAVAVVVPQSPPDAPPLALSVQTPSIPVPVKAATGNSAEPPPITNDVKPESETPASSTDPIAFSARMRKPDEATFVVPAGQNQRTPADVQTVAADQPAPDAGALRGTAQPIEQTGLRASMPAAASAAPAPQTNASVLDPIELPQAPPVPVTPIKDISLHIAGPQNVEVRVSELSGEIRVDVRTADPGLAQDLRGGLHELVSKLDAKGFTTDVSAPSESTISAARSGDAGSSQDRPPGEQQSGARQDEQQRQRQSQNQEAWSRRNQDSWSETISNNNEEFSQ